MDATLPVQPVVVFGPSGAGKSTLLKRVMDEFPGVFSLSVSHTTRGPRKGEQHGREYYFVTREQMREAIANGDFVEHAEFGGNIYGTSRKAIQDVARSNRVCVLDLEMQGCESMRQLSEFDPLFVFIQPPSLDTLEERLLARNSESAESLQRRMGEAEAALDYGRQPGKFDVVVVNDNLESACDKLKSALRPKVDEVQRLQEKE